MSLPADGSAQDAGVAGDPLKIAEPLSDPYPGNFREQAELPEGPAGGLTNQPAAPLQQGNTRRADDNPFLPEGFRIGSWRAYLSLEQTAGYSSNVIGAPGGRAGAISRTDVDFSAQSDWGRHEAGIHAKGTFQRSFGEDGTSLPSASVGGRLRLDLADGWQANGDATYSYDTDTDTGVAAGKHNFFASAGASREAGLLQFSLRGVIDRTVYEDGLTSREDQNNTYYGAIGRVSLAANPGFIPFVEGEVGIRRHDLETDANGEKRDSQVQALRAGIAFDRDGKLNGEISVGWESEDYVDDALKTLSGLTVDGELNWSPERGTNVRLFASTKLDGSTIAGQNGSIVTTAGADVSRAVNDRLEVNAGASAELTRYDDGTDSETVFSASAGFRYWLNRNMALSGTVEHEWLSSDNSALEYDATTIRAGVLFQR